MNTANKITMIRIFLIPVFMICLFSNWYYSKPVAVGIFIIASATDFLDGYIARKYHQITDFGKFIDPLADKLLVTAAFVGLVEFNIMPAWIAIIIIARELIVNALRTVAISSGKVIAASNFGKAKTIVQLIGVALLLSIGYLDINLGIISLNNVLNLIIMIITVFSGIDYLYKNWRLVNTYK
jgi:CDP-diacylglycerol--glycerol-3-phosphate 3-phosphatidyltransferase